MPQVSSQSSADNKQNLTTSCKTWLQAMGRSLVKRLRHQPWHWWLALFLTGMAAFLRFYGLRYNVMFQGDQGRDALIVSRIFKQGDLVFIGPVTSVGNMYLGPLYYYFMLPWLWLSYPSPMGPVYAVAALSSGLIFLNYKLIKKMFNLPVALLSSLFLTFSATAVTHARFSWNPNLAPLFGLLMVYFNWRALKQPKFWIAVAACFSVLIQLHYLTLLAGIAAALLWLWQLRQMISRAGDDVSSNADTTCLKDLLRSTILGILIFILSLTPLILFDFKHQGLNAQAFWQLISDKKTFAHATTDWNVWWQKILSILQETEGRAMHILFEFNLGKKRNLNRWLMLIVLGLSGGHWYRSIQKNKGQKQKITTQYQAHLTLAIYLISAILGTAAYQHSIFDHYIAYLFPITAIIYALSLDAIKQILSGRVATMAGLTFTGWFLSYNLTRLPWQKNYSMLTVRRTAQHIAQKVDLSRPYNLVLLSESKDLYGQNYRYFLSTTPQPPLPVGQHHRAKTLLIIDELKQPQQAVNTEIYEIASFPSHEIERTLHIDRGPNVYILNTE